MLLGKAILDRCSMQTTNLQNFTSIKNQLSRRHLTNLGAYLPVTIPFAVLAH